MAGKHNMMFGVIYLFLAMGLGLFLPEGVVAKNLSTAFIQANIDSALNIVAGYLIYRLPFMGWVSKTVSILMIAGALLHSGALYLAAFGVLPSASMAMPLGVVILASVMLFMGIGALSIKVTSR